MREVEVRNLSEHPDAPMDLEITLVIEKTDSSADEAKMVAAAKALTDAIARALDALRTRAESEVIAVNGVAAISGALIASILNTDHIVPDRPDAFFANYGVGEAESWRDWPPHGSDQLPCDWWRPSGSISRLLWSSQ